MRVGFGLLMSVLAAGLVFAAPLYQYLTRNANPAVAGEVKWNFTKFLVDRNGKAVARFEPAVKPESEEMTAAIEKLLK